MKKIFKRILPSRIIDLLKNILRLKQYAVDVLRDARRFYRHSGVFQKNKAESSLASLITIDYHRLEKGLALPDPRKGFGVTAAGDLQRNMANFISTYGVKPVCLEAISALTEYFSFNDEFMDEGNSLYMRYLHLRELIEVDECAEFSSIAGTVNTTRTEVLNSTNIGYKDFFLHRHSVRSFAEESVDLSLIKDAVAIAQNAPSVCNRQPWKVYCVQSRERVREILEVHGGARGFEDSPDKLLVVAVDLGAFHYAGERNEYWVDGGIFTMSILNALHAVGLGACCLNWCVDHGRDTRLREILNIPPSEVLIVLIAVGHYPEEFKVAVSPTKDTTEVIVYK